MSDLRMQNLWDMQRQYNSVIRKEEGNFDPEYWTQIYLLGMVSEVDEILREINWKKHRKESNKIFDRINLAYELADLTKYVISLWEIWQFSLGDMISYSATKSKILEEKYKQEFETIPEDRPILITDIDGTLGDWRTAFLNWAREVHVEPIIDDCASSLLLDTDLSMRFVDYYNLKERFESGGGYREIIPYEDSIKTIQSMKKDLNVYVIATTARPASSYHRIWLDTWLWLKEHEIPCDKLLIGSEPRLLLADSLNKNRNVIMFEDDPGLILRAANSGIKVFARRQPYNEQIRHENVRIINRYTEIDITDFYQTN